MKRSIFALITFALGVAGSGCATMHPRAHAEGFQFEAFGDATEARQQAKTFRTTLQKEVQELEPEQLAEVQRDVKVLERSFPTGVGVKDGVIAASAESGYEVVGTFKFNPDSGTSFWFADYSSVGRKIYCYPQVPLTWVTLGLWQIFVPLSYPCMAPARIPLEEAYGLVRQAATAAGANTAIITDVRKAEDAEENVFRLEGIFLRFKAAPAPDAQPSHQI
ncbi:MAG: hypothetical protein WBV82_17665 [Myxococcaceae bacterium]